MAPLRLRLHDTLTGALTPLVPRTPGESQVYCCGPTTYDVAHVGHARAALTPDVLVRTLRRHGLRVTYVRNVTDVDDKILKRARESGEDPTELSARMTKLYQDDMKALGCVVPDAEPRASENIPQIIALIEELIAKGSAYVVPTPGLATHDVYYAVRSFPGYGKLSKRNVEELEVSAHHEAAGEKRDPLDFALWKGSGEEAWAWESPWGKGRPGWHIECSAMAARFLGHSFDVHCGGIDLIFPHHENEIAQSEAAHAGEGPFAQVWVHNGLVNVDNEKMGKSLGNFVPLREVYERNDPEALRYFLLSAHYRGPIGFKTEKLADGRVVFSGVLEAERRVDDLYRAIARLDSLNRLFVPELTAPEKMPKDLMPLTKLASGARGRVSAALDEDLNTPVALAVLGELAKAANELVDLAQTRRKDAELSRAAPFVALRLLDALRDAADALGLLQAPLEVYRARTQAQRLRLRAIDPQAIEARLAERTAARLQKDFARSDAIRDELHARGIEIADTPEGSTWRAFV